MIAALLLMLERFQDRPEPALHDRAMIVERVKAGLKRGRAEEIKLGRPRVIAEVEGKIRDQLAARHRDSQGGKDDSLRDGHGAAGESHANPGGGLMKKSSLGLRRAWLAILLAGSILTIDDIAPMPQPKRKGRRRWRRRRGAQ
jgi:hypothetical protein